MSYAGSTFSSTKSRRSFSVMVDVLQNHSGSNAAPDLGEEAIACKCEDLEAKKSTQRSGGVDSTAAQCGGCKQMRGGIEIYEDRDGGAQTLGTKLAVEGRMQRGAKQERDNFSRTALQHLRNIHVFARSGKKHKRSAFH